MLDKLKNLLSKPKEYTEQRAAIESAETKARLSLAKDTKTNKEILYYLAEHDPVADVRKAVANNKSMPVQVAPVLAVDPDEDVRVTLAKRLVTLLPDLSEDKQSQLYAFAVQALGTLALDEVLKVRVALSSALKDHSCTPPQIASQLARDAERTVSEPILRFCTALPDADLLNILKNHPADWVVEAIARRENIGAEISEAVIETENRAGGQLLLENQKADITESLFEKIIAKARLFPEWQKPIATHICLPLSIAKELAEFVDEQVRDLLLGRPDFDEESASEISNIFKRRMDFAAEETGETESAHERVRKMATENKLDEEAINDALGMRDRDFVIAALAYLLKTDEDSVQKIIDMKAPKALVAITWKADLSMRMALQFQKELAHIPPKELLYPKGGTDYPLSEDDLNWQIDFLGL